MWVSRTWEHRYRAVGSLGKTFLLAITVLGLACSFDFFTLDWESFLGEFPDCQRELSPGELGHEEGPGYRPPD